MEVVDNVFLYNSCCFDAMANIPDGSIDLVLTDMPYGTVKGAKFYDYADGVQWDETLDMTKVWAELSRITRPMSNVVLFSQEPFSTHLINTCTGNISFSYRAIWLKNDFANPLIAKKACVNYYEDILVFARNSDDLIGLHPLREYAKSIFSFIDKPIEDINREFGNYRADHFFRFKTRQFELCTEATYLELIERFNISEMDGFLDWLILKEIDIEFKQKNGRVFNLPDGAKSKSNIFEYKKDYDGYHPTQKPVALLEDLIKTFSNKGDTVLDFTMGSGSTGVAAIKTDRKFIGIEKEKKYFDIAVSRIEKLENSHKILAI